MAVYTLACTIEESRVGLTIGGDVTYGGSSIKSYVMDDKRQGKRRDEVVYES